MNLGLPVSLRDLANAIFTVLRAALITGARGLPCEILFSDEPQPIGRFRIGQFLLVMLGFRYTDCGDAKLYPADHQGPTGVKLILRISPQTNTGLSAAEYFEGVASRLRSLDCPLPGLDAFTISLMPIGKIVATYDEGTKSDLYVLDFALKLTSPETNTANDTAKGSKTGKKAAGVKGTPAAAIAANPDQSSVADLAASQETGIA